MQQDASVREDPWFVTAFERIYLHVYPHRDDEEAEAHAPDVCRLLGVHAGQRVLDVACGAGRHTRALARRGLLMTGVDLSEDLLEAAREKSPGLPGTPTYVRWDIRRLPFAAQFDGAISMFTSFGYFDTRDDDLALMRGVHRALLAGGRFLVDFLNEAEVRANLEPSSEVDAGELRLRMERWIEEDAPGGPRVCKRVQAVQRRTGLVQADYEERVRLYTPAELDGLLTEAGFELEGDPLGSFDGTPFDASSPRWIRLARRTGRSS